MWGDAGYVGVQKRAENLGLAVVWMNAEARKWRRGAWRRRWRR